MEGFEPPKAEPESAVLPLHYIPKNQRTFGDYKKPHVLSILFINIIPNLYVHDIDDGEYILLRGVDFGSKGAKKIMASVGSDGIGCIEIHLDSPDSPAVAVIPVSPTGGKNNFTLHTQRFKNRIRGTHDLYLVFTGAGKDLFTLDWWRMK